jgi:hypothetical protein
VFANAKVTATWNEQCFIITDDNLGNATSTKLTFCFVKKKPNLLSVVLGWTNRLVKLLAATQ